MLAKAIATGFNSPFISMPGSGFAATFIGIDAIVVRLLARRAKKLARKWGGQCIVFIDEIDAVGMRRQSLGTGGQGFIPLTDGANVEDFLFFGPLGSRDPSGDLIVETRRWRDRLFDDRATPASYGVSAACTRGMASLQLHVPGRHGRNGRRRLALNQLLVVMDGIDNPPFMRRSSHEQAQHVARRELHRPAPARQRESLRLPAARPRKEQIYFIGATNVPIERLDPALIRPGRMGRHVWFRTPTKQDRLDILDLYIGKVSHDPELDLPDAARRDRADHERVLAGDDRAGDVDGADDRPPHRTATAFDWDDLVEADHDARVGYRGRHPSTSRRERRAVAIHEAGHAVAGHVYMTSSRVDPAVDPMRGTGRRSGTTG